MDLESVKSFFKFAAKPAWQLFKTNAPGWVGTLGDAVINNFNHTDGGTSSESSAKSSSDGGAKSSSKGSVKSGSEGGAKSGSEGGAKSSEGGERSSGHNERSSGYNDIECLLQTSQNKIAVFRENLEKNDTKDLRKLHRFEGEAEKAFHNASDELTRNLNRCKNVDQSKQEAYINHIAYQEMQLAKAKEMLNAIERRLFEKKANLIVEMIEQITREVRALGSKKMSVFTAKYEEIKRALHNAEDLHLEAKRWVDVSFDKSRNESMNEELISLEKKMSNARESVENAKKKVFTRELKKMAKLMKQIKKSTCAAQKMEPKVRVGECARMQSALEEAKDCLQELQDVLKELPSNSDGMKAIKEKLEFQDKEIEDARVLIEQMEQFSKKEEAFDREVDKIVKHLKQVKRAANVAPKMEPKPRVDECLKMQNALEGAEGCLQELQDLLEQHYNTTGLKAMEKKIKRKEKEIADGKKLVEQIEHLSKQEEAFDRDLEELIKHINQIKTSAREAENIAPKLRKSEQFTGKLDKMHSALKEAENCHQELECILNNLPSIASGIEVMKQKLKSTEKELEDARGLVEQSEGLAKQIPSSVCAIL